MDSIALAIKYMYFIRMENKQFHNELANAFL